MFSTYWDAVMNPERNPLSRLPKITRFQLMTVLALMWTTIFCASAGMFAFFPQFVAAHFRPASHRCIRDELCLSS